MERAREPESEKETNCGGRAGRTEAHEARTHPMRFDCEPWSSSAPRALPLSRVISFFPLTTEWTSVRM